MENTYINIQANKQTLKNLINDKNREKFFNEFVDEDVLVKYIISDGIGKDLILSKKQIETMMKTSNVNYEIVDPYEGYCTMIINGLPITIEYF